MAGGCRVSCGKENTVCIDSAGSVWAIGKMYYGNMEEEREECFIPKKLEKLQNIVSVSCNGRGSYFLDTEGKVWCLSPKHTTPFLITGIPPAVDVVSGSKYSLCLDKNGNVWATQCFSEVLSGLPVRLSFENIISIHCFGSRCVCRDNVGSLFIFYIFSDLEVVSCNEFAVVKLQYHEIQKFAELIQIQLERNIILCLDVEGNVWEGEFLGEYEKPVFTKSEEMIGVACLAAGARHRVLIMKDSKMICSGMNSHGQLGIDQNCKSLSFSAVNEIFVDFPQKQLSDVQHVVCGRYHTICKNTNGSVFGIGANTNGQLANQNLNNCLSPFLIPDEYSNLFWPPQNTTKSANK